MCLGEVPLLKELQRRHADDGLELIGVSVDESTAVVDRLVAELGMTWPQICDGEGSEGAVPKLFVMEGTPLVYLIDRGGRIAGRFRSVHDAERHLPEVLSAPDSVPRASRDAWQRPNALMDRLAVSSGSAVADVGSGAGYLTWHLAGRVGAEGAVFAVDLDEEALEKLGESAREKGLSQVRTVRGASDDPNLSDESVEVVVIVDAYHEFAEPQEMLRGLYAGLRPGGRLGILDSSSALGRPRSEYQEKHHLPPEIIIEEAAQQGFRLASFEAGFVERPGDATQYLIVLQKPE